MAKTMKKCIWKFYILAHVVLFILNLWIKLLRICHRGRMIMSEGKLVYVGTSVDWSQSYDCSTHSD